MSLTKWQRKAALKYGAQKAIAKRCRRSASHVSQVISGDRRDAVVEREVARRLKLSVEEVFGPIPEPELEPEVDQIREPEVMTA